jgi:solute carrier family 35 (GDP-fucose transporter), member C1
MVVPYKPLFSSGSNDSLQDVCELQQQRRLSGEPSHMPDMKESERRGVLEEGGEKEDAKSESYISMMAYGSNGNEAEQMVEKERGIFGSVLFAVLFYMLISIAMVLINKFVLNHVSMPLTFLWLQLVISFMILWSCDKMGWLRLEDINLRQEWKQLAPLIVVNVLGLSLNTYCLAYLDASLYQVARSLVLPLTVLFSWLYLRQSISLVIALSCLIIICGFIIGIVLEQAIHISLCGILFGLASSITTAYHSIVIKKSFDSFKEPRTQLPLPPAATPFKSGHSKRLRSASHAFTFDLVFWNNFLSAILLIPFLLLLEGAQMRLYLDYFFYSSPSPTSLLQSQPISPHAILSFLLGSFIAGLMGLLVNIAGFLQIKVTSPITHTVSSATRGVLQTILASLMLHESITLFRIIGIGITCCGTALYTFVKANENQRHNSLKNSTLPLFKPAKT